MRFLLICCLFAAAPLHAEDDHMAVQRCIWACLANSPGAQSAQYNACVAQRCSEAQPASDWSSGLASDQRHRFAGTQAEQGYGFYYFCLPDQSFFTLDSLPVGPGNFRLIIGQIEFIVPFDMARGVLSVDIPPGSPFMQAVRGGGDMLTVRAMDGTHLIRYSLRGAEREIGQVTRACFG